MSTTQIKHFLVVYDIPNGLAHVESFERNYDAALVAYAEAEANYRRDGNVEVVLLGSDSIETLERTHSSYFELAEKHVDRLVARELAELGLS
jgi:hypothetical protein